LRWRSGGRIPAQRQRIVARAHHHDPVAGAGDAEDAVAQSSRGDVFGLAARLADQPTIRSLPSLRSTVPPK
jgi:hypothetical protein